MGMVAGRPGGTPGHPGASARAAQPVGGPSLLVIQAKSQTLAGSAIRPVFAFPVLVWCIEGLSCLMAKRPCQRESTLVEYGINN